MEILFLSLHLITPYRKKGVEDAVMPNNEDINDEVLIDDGDNLASYIDPSKTKLCKLKEWKMKPK